MAERAWKYEVRTDGKIPVLIRYHGDGVYTFYPEEKDPWVRTPLKDGIPYGGGDFVWYDDVTEDEAKKYMKKITDLKLKK